MNLRSIEKAIPNDPDHRGPDNERGDDLCAVSCFNEQRHQIGMS